MNVRIKKSFIFYCGSSFKFFTAGFTMTLLTGGYLDFLFKMITSQDYKHGANIIILFL